MRFSILFALLCLAACTAADVQLGDKASNLSEAPIWSYDAQVADLRARSCPADASFKRAEPLALDIVEAELGSVSARQVNLEGLHLAGAWHLMSDNDEFGGISGLDVMRSGSLLAVTDDGKFVWIGIDPETGAPDGVGSITYLKNQTGKIFPNKRSADAEDLVVRDGLAFVSFEQEHRIEAYDLESCGAAARAARVVKLDKVIDGRILENNRGAEALALDGDQLRIGFESQASGGSPMGTVHVDGTLADFQRTRQPLLFLLTGMDISQDITAQVFRAYDPARGPRAILQVRNGGAQIAKATLKKPLPVDNFEAVAIAERPDGGTRIWLMSDDNFNKSQRTLLLAFELTQSN
jgi:hypothetical protein